MRRARVCGSFQNGIGGARLGSGGSWEPWGAQCPPCILSDPLPCPHPPSFSGQVEGRLGPSTVVLDHTGGFEGLLLVDDDLLGVSEGKGPRSKLLLM